MKTQLSCAYLIINYEIKLLLIIQNLVIVCDNSFSSVILSEDMVWELHTLLPQTDLDQEA